MSTFLLRRVLWAIVAVPIILSIVYLLIDSLGDPAVAALGPKATRERMLQWRVEHGYVYADTKKPIPVYIRLPRDLGQLAMGTAKSTREDAPLVTDVLWQRLPRTALLGLMAMLFELGIGVTIGILAAVKRRTWVDLVLMAVAFVGISAPTFLTGLLFLYYIAFRLGWFAIGGYGTTGMDHLWHAIPPAITLSIIGAATYARVTRSEMIETLRSDYVRTARAKGASSLRAVLKHALRNAALPVVTLLGLNFTIIVSGAVITESIYSWPGMGRLLIESLLHHDQPMVMGVVLVAALAVQIGSLLADIGVALLDPRVRVG